MSANGIRIGFGEEGIPCANCNHPHIHYDGGAKYRAWSRCGISGCNCASFSEPVAVPPSDSGAAKKFRDLVAETMTPEAIERAAKRTEDLRAETPPAPTAFDAEFKKLEAIAARVIVARQKSDASDSEANYRSFCREASNWERATRPSVLLPLLASLRESLAGVQQENGRLKKLEAIAMVEHGIHGGFPEGGLLAVGQSLIDRAATIERQNNILQYIWDALDNDDYTEATLKVNEWQRSLPPSPTESPVTSQLATPHPSETAK